MTIPKRKTPAAAMKANDALTVEQTSNETAAQALARKLLQPTFKNAAAASAFTGKMMGSGIELPGVGDYADHIFTASEKAAGGDLAMASSILAAHAIALDSMFAEFARRSAMNMGEYIQASERYARLALKAQSNCRATLEALAKIHQPREQTVRHVHVNEGGQAVIAEQFHHHSGGGQNAKSTEQPHAPENRAAGVSSSLPGEDPQRDSLPRTRNKGCEPLPYAQRKRGRSTNGEQ